MTWPWALPLVLALPYWIGFAVVWRSLTGHVAWSVHRTAKTNPTVRPPTENWVAAGFCCLPLAFIWFVVILFVIHWPRRLQRGAEREAEVEFRDLTLKQLQAKNELMYEKVTGNVIE